MPRVALVLNTVGLGGVPQAALDLARHLPSGEFEPVVYVLKVSEDDAASRALRAARFVDAGIGVHHGAAGGGKLGAIAALAEWLERERVDLVHTHSYRPNLYARLAATLRRPHGLRVVAHYHNQYDDKWDADPSALVIERGLAAQSDALLACSASVREHVAARLGVDPGRITVIENGVDAARFGGGDRAAARRRLGLGADAFAVGLVGRVCEQKGQSDLVEAAIALADRAPSLVVLMAGAREDRELQRRLGARAEQAGIGARVRWLGHVDDMAGLYAALDLVVAPSRWEGFGLMLVEAMAAARPIVATRVGAIADVVREDETALLVPARDPRALAAAIERVMTDPALAARLGAAGPARASGFSWARSGARLAAVYRTALAGAPGRGPGG